MNHTGSTRHKANLEYMQAMLGQLRVMAEAERCDVLAYLIDMARVEAGDLARAARDPARADGTGVRRGKHGEGA